MIKKKALSNHKYGTNKKSGDDNRQIKPWAWMKKRLGWSVGQHLAQLFL